MNICLAGILISLFLKNPLTNTRMCGAIYIYMLAILTCTCKCLHLLKKYRLCFKDIVI